MTPLVGHPRGMRSEETLLERGEETAAIEAALEAAGDGDGASLVVEGPAGIGKSALLDAARRRARARGMTVLGARGDELEADFPYGVARQLLERRVHDDPGLLAGSASLAAGALGLTGPEPHPPAVGPREPESDFAIVHALYWVAVNLADDGPVLLTVDDLHHCDTPSRRFLRYVARRLDGIGIALVVATRPGQDQEDEPWSDLPVAPFGRVLRPALLSAPGSEQFVRDRTDGAPSTAFVAACHRASGGNPFLLTELLVTARSDGLGTDDAAATSVASLSPRGVARSVLLRLHALPAAATALARAIGTFGDTATVLLAGRATGMGTGEAADLCDRLVRAGVLAPGRPLSFVHPVIGEAIRDDTPHGERARLHRTAAQLLAAEGAGPDLVAAHLALTDEAGDPWAAESLWAAGRLARDRGDPDAAVRWLSRALAEGVSPVPAALLADLGEAEWLAGDPTAALDHLRASVSTIEDPAEQAEIALLAARVQASVADLVGAGTTIEAVLADRDRLPAATVLLLEAEAATYQLLNQVDADVVAARLAPLAGSTGGTVPGLLIQCSLAATRLVKGSAAEAVGFARRGLADDRLLDGGAGASFPFMAALTAFSLAEDQEEAGAVFDRALQHARDRGATAAFTYVCGTAAIGAWISGDLRRCEQMARDALDPDLPVGYARPILHAYLALALMEQGDLDGAARALDDSGLDQGLPTASQSIHAAYACGRLRHLRGRPDAALEVLRCQGDPGLAENHLPHPPWRLEAASCLLDLGGTTEAALLVREHAVHAERWGTTAARGATRRLEALTLDGEARLAGLAAADALLAASPARLERARCLLDLGVVHRAAGHTREAREALRAAYDGAGRCGSAVLAEQARSELLASGARPRRQELTGLAALTASERRVCELAAGGLTNAQIAQQLFVTRSTVEKHLSHAYDKVGITSREGLNALWPKE
jgi:DNA-binding CsgD family transcriptional regulator